MGEYKIVLKQKKADETEIDQEVILHTDFDSSASPQPRSRFITRDAFLDYLGRAIPGGIPDSEIIGIRFNRSTLQLMLAFPSCEGVLFFKSKKHIGGSDVDTITAVAIDNTGKPLGWDPITPTKFISSEWGQAFTKGDIITALGIPHPITPDKFFEKLKTTEFFDNLNSMK